MQNIIRNIFNTLLTFYKSVTYVFNLQKFQYIFTLVRGSIATPLPMYIINISSVASLLIGYA